MIKLIPSTYTLMPLIASRYSTIIYHMNTHTPIVDRNSSMMVALVDWSKFYNGTSLEEATL